MSLAPRVLIHSSNDDLERELLIEEAEAEREPLLPIEVTEIRQWYAWETEARSVVLRETTKWAVIVPIAHIPVVRAPQRELEFLAAHGLTACLSSMR